MALTSSTSAHAAAASTPSPTARGPVRSLQRVQRFQPRTARTAVVLSPVITQTVRNVPLSASASIRPQPVKASRTGAHTIMKAITARIVTPNDRTTGLARDAKSLVTLSARKFTRQPVTTMRALVKR